MSDASIAKDAEEGFTLVETIVAFLVLAIAMGVATQTISIATNGLRRSSESDQLIELAKSVHLIELPKLVAAGATASEGNDPRGHWTITLNPEDGRPYRAGSFVGFADIAVSVPTNVTHPDHFIYFDRQSPR